MKNIKKQSKKTEKAGIVWNENNFGLQNFWE